MVSSPSNNNDSTTSYFYNGYRGQGLGNSLPPQMIPQKKKNKKFIEETLDILESIGIRQFKENIKFKDFYKMVRGELVYSDYLDIPPQLREVQKVREDFEIPTFLKHYDLIGIITNALTGEYMRNADKFVVTNTDEFASNEFERTRNDLLQAYVKEEFEKELNLRLITQGLNPNRNDFQSEEEQIQFMQQVQQAQQELTPPEIETYMQTKWTTKAAKWGEHTLENDRERFYMDEMSRNEFQDFLLTGRCFRHHYLGYDYYKPETWSPLNTFFSQDVETKYVQNGEYVGRVHFYTPSQIINKYGHKLSESQKKLVMGNRYYKYPESNIRDGSGSLKDGLETFNQQRVIAPHEQFLDQAFINNLQDELGIPLATSTTKDKYGNDVEMPAFFPRRNNFNTLGGNHYYAKILRGDLTLRSDLVQVTEAYWISYRRIAYLNYRTESGRLARQIVSEDILVDFLKENNIRQLTTATLEEIEGDPEKFENSLVWDYIPEVRYGVKLNPGHSYLKKPIYLGGEAMDHQLKGDSEVYDVQLPVSGYVGNSMALKIKPFQVSYNIVMNQLFNILEKEIGLFYIFDINFLPSEFKDYGDTEDTLMHLREIARDVGLFPIDTSKQNTRAAVSANQMTPQNMSLSSQMADRQSLSQFYKSQAFEQVGITPQRLGTPTTYETEEGVKQGAEASYAQTEVLFEQFSDYLKRTYDIHLNVAQYAQKTGKDIAVFYTKSDNTQAWLKFQDENFQNRKLGILPISNSKKRKELETFKGYLLNNNTLTNDVFSLASLITSDSIVELMEVAREERFRAQEQAQRDQQSQVQILEKEAEIEEQKEIAQWRREETSKEADRINKIEVERIESLGRAVDNDADGAKLDFINKSADIAIKKRNSEATVDLKEREIEGKKISDQQDRKIKMREINLKAQELREKVNKRKSDEFIARINKN